MLKVNDTVKGSCKVIKVKVSTEGQQIIMVSGWSNVTPFVVWRYCESDKSFHSGDYCQSLEGALKAFEKRH